MDNAQTITLRPPVWALIAAVFLGGLFFLGGTWIETGNDPERATISISGDGRAFAVPDIAEISVGVQTGRQPTAAKAMERLKTSMDTVIAAIEKAGVARKDIRTENFWLNPVYDYREGEQVPRGFEANQSVRVKVRNLDKVSDVLGAATAAGANQAGSVNFTVDDPEGVRAQAREEAIKEAKEKAQLLADQLGVRLKKIVGFNEGFGGGVPPVYMERAAYGMGGGGGADMAQSIPLPPGEQEVTVNVSITYEVE